jgi:hypothetical protein
LARIWRRWVFRSSYTVRAAGNQHRDGDGESAALPQSLEYRGGGLDATRENGRLTYFVVVFGVHSVHALSLLPTEWSKEWAFERQTFPSEPIAGRLHGWRTTEHASSLRALSPTTVVLAATRGDKKVVIW